MTQETEYNITLRSDGRLSFSSHGDRMTLVNNLKHKTIANILDNVDRLYPEEAVQVKSRREFIQWLLNDEHANKVLSISPEVVQILNDKIQEVEKLEVPVMPLTDTERLSFVSDKMLVAKQSFPDMGLNVTVGKEYKIQSRAYDYREKFTRRKPFFNPDTEEMDMEEHQCTRRGRNRLLQFRDDDHSLVRFVDQKVARKGNITEFDESMFWRVFEKPKLDTVKERFPEEYNNNIDKLSTHEILAGFQYYPGQKDYIARNAIKNFGQIAAETGCGKSLMAIAISVLKEVDRCLIMAPKGTVKGQGTEYHYDPAQWEREIRHFAPQFSVHKIMSQNDYEKIRKKNNGTLPKGFYITYPEAFLTNESFEELSDKMSEMQFRKKMGMRGYSDGEEVCSKGVGLQNDNGIKCIAKPSVATKTNDLWDMVMLDESHLMQNINTKKTRAFLRLQAKYRYALSATPIPNTVIDMFGVMGWLCVPDWYKGYRRNVAWPYASTELNRFEQTFLANERDHTAEKQKRMQGVRNPRVVIKSPIVSAPSELLKLLKPIMSYINKEKCNPSLVPCNVQDVRVPFGKSQEKLYALYADRRNIPVGNPLMAAMTQHTYLRGVCSEPATCQFNTGVVQSNFNPKVVSALEIASKCFGRKEQIMFVASRCGQLDELQKRLEEANVKCSRIDSTSKHHARQAQDFKDGKTHVMLMGIKMAQAFSFDQCSNLAILSLEWSYGAKHQAMGRVYRVTSKNPINVWCILNENSVEEVMFDRVANKADAATLCLRGERVPNVGDVVDASEVIADHLINYRSNGKVLPEEDCEKQWDGLKKHIASNIKQWSA